MSSSSLVQDESSAFSDRFPGSYNFEKHSSNSCTRFFAICLAWCLHVAEIESNNYCDTKHLKVVYVTICSGLHVSITFIGHMWADCHMENETSPSLSVAYTNTPVDDLLKSVEDFFMRDWMDTTSCTFWSASCQCLAPLHDQRETVANERVPRSPFKCWCWHLGKFKSDIWISRPDLGPQIEDAQNQISFNCNTKGTSPLYLSSSFSLSFVKH